MVLQCACWDVFRELGRGDIQTIVAILNDAAGVYEEEIAALLTVTPDQIEADFDSGARSFGAEMTGDLTAVVTIRPVGEGFELIRLGVLPPLQGFGVAGMLLRDLKKEIVEERPFTVNLPDPLAPLADWFTRMGVVGA